VAGLVPFQGGFAARLPPAAGQRTLHAVPRLAPVLGPRLPAVLVGRAEVPVLLALRHVVPGLVVVPPVGVLGGRVDRPADAAAGMAADHAADDGPDYRAHGAAARGHAGRGAAQGRANTRAARMGPRCTR